MDISLKKTLVMFLIYMAVGFVWLYNGHIAKSRREKLFSGLILITHAAFLLSAIALVTTSLNDLAKAPKTTIYIREQVSGFLPYIVFLSGIFTFLFGGVGTNFVSSAITSEDNKSVLESVDKIEKRMDTLEIKVDHQLKSSKG